MTSTKTYKGRPEAWGIKWEPVTRDEPAGFFSSKTNNGLPSGFVAINRVALRGMGYRFRMATVRQNLQRNHAEYLAQQQDNAEEASA